jgi:hypothetical protein
MLSRGRLRVGGGCPAGAALSAAPPLPWPVQDLADVQKSDLLATLGTGQRWVAVSGGGPSVSARLQHASPHAGGQEHTGGGGPTVSAPV